MDVFRKPAGRRNIRGGIVEDRNRMFLAGTDPILPLDLPQRLIAVQEKEHRRAGVDRLFELGEGFNPDQLRTEQQHLGLVAALVALLNDDFVLEPLGVGKLVDRGGMIADHAGGRGDGDRRGGACRDHRGRNLEQPGDPRADLFLKLRDRDEPAGRLGHRLQHLLRHERAAQGRVRSLGVDQRLDTKIRVDVLRLNRHGFFAITRSRLEPSRNRSRSSEEKSCNSMKPVSSKRSSISRML